MSAAAEREEPSVALRLASLPSGGDWAEDRSGEPPRRAEVAAEAEAGEEASGARRFALCLAPEAGAEVQEVEESIEEMLIRLDEFCGMTDMIRSNTSQLLDEAIPLIKAKMIDMNNIYMKVDKLEAFVKMVGQHVSFLEEQVLQAEKTNAVIPYTVRKLFGSAAIPLFNKRETGSYSNISLNAMKGSVGDHGTHWDSILNKNAPRPHSTLTVCQNSTELKTIFLSST